MQPTDSEAKNAGNLRLQATGLSDRGLKRGHNEDSLSVVAEMGLFIVADGMGGHNAGEVASRRAIESMVDFVRHSEDAAYAWPYPEDNRLSRVENKAVVSIKVANRDVCNLSLEHPEYSGMGTTIVAMLYDDANGRATVAHVGDSRCYLLRNGQLQQLTLDHSWVSEQLQKKIITPEEAKNHRWKNVITRALGNKLDVDVDVQTIAILPNDVFMLCTDGLSGMVDDEALEQILLDHVDLEEGVQKMIERANSHGGLDNVSVVLARLIDDSELQPKE